MKQNAQSNRFRHFRTVLDLLKSNYPRKHHAPPRHSSRLGDVLVDDSTVIYTFYPPSASSPPLADWSQFTHEACPLSPHVSPHDGCVKYKFPPSFLLHLYIGVAISTARDGNEHFSDLGGGGETQAPPQAPTPGASRRQQRRPCRRRRSVLQDRLPIPVGSRQRSRDVRDHILQYF